MAAPCRGAACAAGPGVPARSDRQRPPARLPGPSALPPHRPSG